MSLIFDMVLEGARGSPKCSCLAHRYVKESLENGNNLEITELGIISNENS